MKLKLVFISFLFLLSSGIIHAQLSITEQLAIAHFTDQINRDLNKDGVHGGISAAIIKNGRIIYCTALGYKGYDSSTKADTTTIYRIGSVTKTFTATLMMELAEEGKIRLDEPVEDFVPEIKKLNGYKPNDKITFRQIASHTAGLEREPEISNANTGPVDRWEKTLLGCIPYTSVYASPGQEFKYSNMGFAILGLALSRAAGIPFTELIQKKILEPLHMNDTYFLVPKDKMKRLAMGIDNTSYNIDTELPFHEIQGRGYRVPNGGLFSTPSDLAQFVLTFMNAHPLLSNKSLDEMLKVPEGGKKYGLGLMIYRSDELNAFGHNGVVPGYTAQFMIDKNTDYAVIIMRNYNKGATNLEKISEQLLQELAVKN